VSVYIYIVKLLAVAYVSMCVCVCVYTYICIILRRYVFYVRVSDYLLSRSLLDPTGAHLSSFFFFR